MHLTSRSTTSSRWQLYLTLLSSRFPKISMYATFFFLFIFLTSSFRNTTPPHKRLSSSTLVTRTTNSHSNHVVKPMRSSEIISSPRVIRGSILMGAHTGSLSVVIFPTRLSRLARRVHSHPRWSGSRSISKQKSGRLVAGGHLEKHNKRNVSRTVSTPTSIEYYKTVCSSVLLGESDLKLTLTYKDQIDPSRQVFCKYIKQLPTTFNVMIIS